MTRWKHFKLYCLKTVWVFPVTCLNDMRDCGVQRASCDREIGMWLSKRHGCWPPSGWCEEESRRRKDYCCTSLWRWQSVCQWTNALQAVNQSARVTPARVTCSCDVVREAILKAIWTSFCQKTRRLCQDIERLGKLWLPVYSSDVSQPCDVIYQYHIRLLRYLKYQIILIRIIITQIKTWNTGVITDKAASSETLYGILLDYCYCELLQKMSLVS